MRHLTIVALITYAIACQSQHAPLEPAKIADLDDPALAELSGIIAKAIAQESVNLNRQVFADNHILVLEHDLQGAKNGRYATGRLTEKPETWHLLTDGKRCVTQRLKTGERFPLTHVRCRAIALK